MSRPTIVEAAEALSARIGSDKITMKQHTDSERSSEYRIQTPLLVTPHTEDDVIQVLSWANEHEYVVAPQGGGTKDAWGCSRTQPDLILSMRQMNRIMDHSAGDLIVTAQAGTTLAELQRVLAEQGQFLPLDPGHDDQTTLGGMVAANTSGLRRGLYGSVRDYVIATRVVLPDGRLIRTGAKVVKNVAGYDMNKLFVGSMGTLGVLTEVTLKIRPIPRSTGMAVIESADPGAVRQLQAKLLDTRLEPCVFEFVHKLPEHPQTSGVVVTFDDVEDSVRFQLNEVVNYAKEAGLTVLSTDMDRKKSERTMNSIRADWPTAQSCGDDQTVVSLKISSLLASVTEWYRKASEKAEQSGFRLAFNGGLQTGISRAVIFADTDQDEQVVEWIQSLQSFASERQEHAVVELAPARIKSNIEVWGQSRAEMALMKGIKNKLDPQGILNRGRFVGGI